MIIDKTVLNAIRVCSVFLLSSIIRGKKIFNFLINRVEKKHMELDWLLGGSSLLALITISNLTSNLLKD